MRAPKGRDGWHDWVYLELATLTADAVDPSLDGSRWTRGLLVRRGLTDAGLAFFTTWCPAGTPAETWVAVEGRRWAAIEDAFEAAKTELGLDHDETRSWHGWHRHVSLVMLAFAMLAVVRHRAGGIPPKSWARRPSRSSAGQFRRSDASPRASPSAGSSLLS